VGSILKPDNQSAIEGEEGYADPKRNTRSEICLLDHISESGVAVVTPVWFAERDEKLYVKTRIESGKSKRIRNNPSVRVAPCTIRAKILGPEFVGTARILAVEHFGPAKEVINRKYFLARLSFWNSKNEYLEIEFAG
jgi:PPOX class probable F420-dependent enzyme